MVPVVEPTSPGEDFVIAKPREQSSAQVSAHDPIVLNLLRSSRKRTVPMRAQRLSDFTESSVDFTQVFIVKIRLGMRHSKACPRELGIVFPRDCKFGRLMDNWPASHAGLASQCLNGGPVVSYRACVPVHNQGFRSELDMRGIDVHCRANLKFSCRSPECYFARNHDRSVVQTTGK